MIISRRMFLGSAAIASLTPYSASDASASILGSPKTVIEFSGSCVLVKKRGYADSLSFMMLNPGVIPHSNDYPHQAQHVQTLVAPMDGVTWDKKTPPIAVIDIKRVQHGVWQLAGDINVTSEDEGAETSCEGDLQLEESDGGRDGNSLARLANVSRLLGSDNNPKPVQNKVSGLVVADVKLKGASVSTVESDNSDHKKKWKCGDKTARRMAARIACKFRSAVVIELKKGEIVLKRGANAAITSHPIEPSRSSAQLDHFVAYYALLDCDDFGNAPIPGDEYSTLGINPIYCPPAAAEP